MLNLVVRRCSLGAEVAPEPCLTACLRSGEGRIPQVPSLLQSALLAIGTPLSAGDADVQCFLCCSGRLDLASSSKQLSVRFRAELVPNGGAVPNSTVFTSGGTSRSEDLARKSTPGTLWGVYMPCLQCTLGIILFLRLPWITAQAGAVQATLIVTMCVAVAALTALSISAIFTNGALGQRCQCAGCRSTLAGTHVRMYVSLHARVGVLRGFGVIAEKIEARGLYGVISKNLGKGVCVSARGGVPAVMVVNASVGERRGRSSSGCAALRGVDDGLRHVRAGCGGGVPEGVRAGRPVWL